MMARWIDFTTLEALNQAILNVLFRSLMIKTKDPYIFTNAGPKVSFSYKHLSQNRSVANIN